MEKLALGVFVIWFFVVLGFGGFIAWVIWKVVEKFVLN